MCMCVCVCVCVCARARAVCAVCAACVCVCTHARAHTSLTHETHTYTDLAATNEVVGLEDVIIPHAELQDVSLERAVIELEGLVPNGVVVVLHRLGLHLLVSVFQTHNHVRITLRAYIETREIACAIHTYKQYAGKLRRSYFTLDPLLHLDQRASLYIYREA